MKKYLLSISAVILAVGFSAFTGEKHNDDPMPYNWKSAVNPNDDIFNKTRNEALIHYEGCDQGSSLCAEAYDISTNDRVQEQDLNFTP